jgi:hypothetical protein
MHKPFKGMSAYEWQIGPFVLMWWFNRSTWVTREPRRWYYNKILGAYLWEFSIRRFLVWNDPLWRA